MRPPHAAVPLIDLEDENACEKIAKACKEIGFFAIPNHGVDLNVAVDLFSASAGFSIYPKLKRNVLVAQQCGISLWIRAIVKPRQRENV